MPTQCQDKIQTENWLPKLETKTNLHNCMEARTLSGVKALISQYSRPKKKIQAAVQDNCKSREYFKANKK